VRDADGRIALAAKEKPPVLPTASGALVSVPDARSAEGKALVAELAQGAGPAGKPAEALQKPLSDLIDAISRERERYSVRELAVMLAIIENETGGTFRSMSERCSATEVLAVRKIRLPKDVDPATCFESLYGGRAGLGNTQPGDGYRFRGRGYFQFTGRANYAKLARAWNLDYVGNPDLLEQPQHAFRAALWWSEAGLKTLREHPKFAVGDPALFPFAEAIRPLLRSISGHARELDRIAARAPQIEAVLRQRLR
jgi:predicted chitinase